MNYLALAQRAHRECEAAGSGPSTVVSQTGENRRLVDWVAQAYTELQQRHTNWRWLRSTWTVNATSGDDTYAATDCTDSRLSATISRFAQWWPFDERGRLNVRSYLSSAGVGTEGYLGFLDWADFRAMYKIGAQNNSTPAHFTIDPQNNIVLGPKPNGTFVVSGEYQMSAQTLDEDADTPELPADYHMLIVYLAMQKYGAAKSAVEVFQRGEYEGTRMLRMLEANQLPPISFAEPLV